MKTIFSDLEQNTIHQLSIKSLCEVTLKVMRNEPGVAGYIVEELFVEQFDKIIKLASKAAYSPDLIDGEFTYQVKTACGTTQKNGSKSYKCKLAPSSSTKITAQQYKKLFDKFVLVNLEPMLEYGEDFIEFIVLNSEELHSNYYTF